MRTLVMLILMIFLLAPRTSHAEEPGFGVEFRFQPPIESSTSAIPPVMLDICGDQSCMGAANSLQLTCTASNVPGRPDIQVHECGLQARLGRRGPDEAMAYLSRPVSLRLRVNNMVSLPFYFGGGQPSEPHTLYRFRVSPGPNGFAVTPG